CSLPNAASWLAASRCPVTRVLVGDWVLAGSALAPCSEVRSPERACLAGIAAEMAMMARDTPRVRRIFIRSGLHVGLQHRASAADPRCAPSRIDGRTVAVGVVPGHWGCPGRTRGEMQTNSNQLLLALSTSSRMQRVGHRKSGGDEIIGQPILSLSYLENINANVFLRRLGEAKEAYLN